jgi:hypothetical protein
MCRRGKGVAETLIMATRLSVLECQHQFKDERWNCSLGQYRQKILQKGMYLRGLSMRVMDHRKVCTYVGFIMRVMDHRKVCTYVGYIMRVMDHRKVCTYVGFIMRVMDHRNGH